jgi:hypothetical protein
MRCVSPITTTTCPITTCVCARIAAWECAVLAVLHASCMRYLHSLLNSVCGVSARIWAWACAALALLLHAHYYMRYLRATPCYYMLLHAITCNYMLLHAITCVMRYFRPITCVLPYYMRWFRPAYTCATLGLLIHTNYMRYLMRCATWLDELLY